MIEITIYLGMHDKWTFWEFSTSVMKHFHSMISWDTRKLCDTLSSILQTANLLCVWLCYYVWQSNDSHSRHLNHLVTTRPLVIHIDEHFLTEMTL